MNSRVFHFAAAICTTALVGSVVLEARQAPQHNHGAAPKAAQTAKAQPAPKPAPPGALPALPTVPFEPVRPMPVVRQVYEFAARHPEVLTYVPCYCGCERSGHGGNHDCFVKSRAANGRITEWDAHGMGCAICLEVGRRAMTLFNQGATVQAIRTAIDREYGSRFPSQTPTPQPPKAPASNAPKKG